MFVNRASNCSCYWSDSYNNITDTSIGSNCSYILSKDEKVLVHKLFTIILNVVVDSNQAEHCVETENKTKDSPQAEPGINGLSFIINDLNRICCNK